ncbi:MAG: DNA polymerase III subunit gamma/tau [Acidobacteria bacterium]|nr:DNA polymerase III subunit gamma/tau [Acidobacteriota bacterium]
MVYQVLARSWRPQRFADLIGQEAVVQTLQNALAAGTFGHAYLFSGLRGVGKTTAARLLAKAVNCEKGPTAEPCGECLSCREIAAGSSLDVIEIDGASNRKIDDVRELRELLRYHPSRDRFRVIIIDEVHMLTREAFNALLKSLEEPPPYILFIFATTERHKVPATILSRCQQLEFRPVGTRRIADHLATIAQAEGFTMSPEAGMTIARAAEGSVRDALSLVDQLRAFSGDAIDEAAVASVLGVPRSEQMTALVGRLAAGEAGPALELLRSELAAGHDAVMLYQEMGRTLRLMLHLAADPDLEPDLTEARREQLAATSAGLGVEALIRMLGLWVEQEPLLREASNRELALEVACLRLSRWPAVQRIEALLADGGSPPLAPEDRPARTMAPRPPGRSRRARIRPVRRGTRSARRSGGSIRGSRPRSMRHRSRATGMSCGSTLGRRRGGSPIFSRPPRQPRCSNRLPATSSKGAPLCACGRAVRPGCRTGRRRFGGWPATMLGWPIFSASWAARSLR